MCTLSILYGPPISANPQLRSDNDSRRRTCSKELSAESVSIKHSVFFTNLHRLGLSFMMLKNTLLTLLFAALTSVAAVPAPEDAGVPGLGKPCGFIATAVNCAKYHPKLRCCYIHPDVGYCRFKCPIVDPPPPRVPID
ncbi:hypothetical protein NP233_g6470 [Leucocoprinus birnbaumii]|uniref:Uncharacterized protein n=1 Tax=Leucocoprinus birnbaumii TaxID=56174 RepID=A0AAD5YVR5_9AGAR|nr:hypothetical protein NP233_g6470 [Leucocoprinus birnbaumii]